jgi:ankyrin repeat protein
MQSLLNRGFMDSRQEIYLFQYHSAIGSLPKKGIVTERSKEIFERGRSEQGYVILEWIDVIQRENSEGKIIEERIKYIELVPAFNKDDKRPRTDKNGTDYIEEEMVISDQPRSGNTGTVHPDAIQLLIKYYEKIDLKKAIRFAKAVKFGGGLTKAQADDENLLDKIMNRSTSQNAVAIKYHPQYIFANFYGNKSDFKRDNPENYTQYDLRRSEPKIFFEESIKQILNQLPCPEDKKRSVQKIDQHNFSYEEEWLKIMHDPKKRNEKMMHTLFMAAGLGDNDRIISLVDILKENIQLDSNFKEEKKQTIELIKLLNICEAAHGNKTALMIAAEQGNIEGANLLLNEGASINLKDDKDNSALMLAVKNNHTIVASLLITKGAMDEQDKVLNEAIKKENWQIVSLILMQQKGLGVDKHKLLEPYKKQLISGFKKNILENKYFSKEDALHTIAIDTNTTLGLLIKEKKDNKWFNFLYSSEQDQLKKLIETHMKSSSSPDVQPKKLGNS